jgi:hypothetical protein
MISNNGSPVLPIQVHDIEEDQFFYPDKKEKRVQYFGEHNRARKKIINDVVDPRKVIQDRSVAALQLQKSTSRA